MKPVLMIAPYFVPRRRVGALRPFKFAIHLRKFGYQPVIITIANPGSELTAKEKKLLDGIRIIEVSSPIDRTEKPDKIASDNDGSPSLSETLLGWIDKQTPVDSWIYLFKARYASILKEVQEVNPEIIWATGDPWSGLWLGEKLSTDLSKPFVADFRDPWTITKVNLRKRSIFSAGWDQEAEKKVVSGANKLIFTSNLTEKNYREHYGFNQNKSETIYNSYDATLSEPDEGKPWQVEMEKNVLNMIFFGRFRRLSPVKPVADALAIIRKKFPDDLGLIRIHSFGEPDPEDQKLLSKYKIRDNFVFHEPVVPENMIPVLQSADILLLSTNLKREEIIPAKLWDYLSVEIPIFSIAPNPEVSEIIMRTKAGIQVHPNEKNEIAEIIRRFAIAKKNNENFLLLPEKDIPDRKMYEATHTTAQLAAIFDELITNA